MSVLFEKENVHSVGSGENREQTIQNWLNKSLATFSSNYGNFFWPSQFI